jgi:hypothetical protein
LIGILTTTRKSEMKALLTLSLFLIAAAAQADGYPTVTQLQVPPALIGVGIPSRLACVPVGFRADDSVYGACHTETSPPCSGRGCQPVTSITNYTVSWDIAGTPTLGGACELIVQHSPGPDRITYLNGHSAVDCFNVVYNPNKTSVAIPYAPGKVAYYPYVSTSTDGAYELVDSAIVTF